MNTSKKAVILAVLATVACIAILIFTVNAAKGAYMPETKYTLKTYTGVGSGVLKHGSIVKVVDGQPVVVGHFDDDSGAEYPGTVQIEEVN